MQRKNGWPFISLVLLGTYACEAEPPPPLPAPVQPLGPCHDEATLIATTAGSPNGATCWHPWHRMRIEPATRAGEEVGAVAFCQCVPPLVVPPDGGR